MSVANIPTAVENLVVPTHAVQRTKERHMSEGIIEDVLTKGRSERTAADEVTFEYDDDLTSDTYVVHLSHGARGWAIKTAYRKDGEQNF